MAKINQKNSKGQRHGFWKISDLKCHYVNGVCNGRWKSSWFESQYRNGKILGIELYEGHYNSNQHFYKQEKQFGEVLDNIKYIKQK